MIVIFLLGTLQGWAEEEEAQAPQQFQGFNLVGYTDAGTKSWDVQGDTADIIGNEIKLNNIVANSYGNPPVNLTAKTGTIQKDSGHIHLEQDVIITSQEGSKLTTDSLDWERDKDLITTDDPVMITDPRVTATGMGLTAHPGLKTAQMNEDVIAHINPEPDQPKTEKVTVTCDGPMEIDQAKHMATFNKNVVAVQLDRVLKADKVEVYFDDQTNQITEMVCTGNVEIKQGENSSFSERAIYRAADQKLILLGRPKLILYTESSNSIASFGEGFADSEEKK
jgi:LPS export ABC transporter protein LptC/lipopolysaccharide transport protein LptA